MRSVHLMAPLPALALFACAPAPVREISHGGLLGLAMRGGGIREKLAEEFALHISRQITVHKNKTKS